MLYHCLLTLHDNVFFATREMGILYETGKFLHNWALSYAFFSGRQLSQPYRLSGDRAQRPSYFEAGAENSLLVLNNLGIYVFPAQPLEWSYQINTFKAAQTAYYGRSKQFGERGADRNYPINYGRAKELAVGSRYRTYLLAPEAVTIPRWIRLGKWAAKVRVEVLPIPERCLMARSGAYACLHPLNPLDLPPEMEVRLYDRAVMPPSSLFSRAHLVGEHWAIAGEEWQAYRREYPHLPREVYLPRSCTYGASYPAASAS